MRCGNWNCTRAVQMVTMNTFIQVGKGFGQRQEPSALQQGSRAGGEHECMHDHEKLSATLKTLCTLWPINLQIESCGQTRQKWRNASSSAPAVVETSTRNLFRRSFSRLWRLILLFRQHGWRARESSRTRALSRNSNRQCATPSFRGAIFCSILLKPDIGGIRR